MTKLSKKQFEVIRLMREGEKVHYMDGLNPRCFWHGSLKTISWATIGKLEDLRLIKRPEYSGYFELTELGKELPINADHSHVVINFEK